MNKRCLQLVAAKRAAEGTVDYEDKLRECSEGILEEFNKYTERTREKLKTLPKSSKQWWKLAKGVTLQTTRNSSIPLLKKTDGAWATTAKEKCNLLLDTLTKKYRLAEKEEKRVQRTTGAGRELCGRLSASKGQDGNVLFT